MAGDQLQKFSFQLLSSKTFPSLQVKDFRESLQKWQVVLLPISNIVEVKDGAQVFHFIVFFCMYGHMYCQECSIRELVISQSKFSGNVSIFGSKSFHNSSLVCIYIFLGMVELQSLLLAECSVSGLCDQTEDHGPAYMYIAFHCSHLYITNPGSVCHFARTWVSLQTTTYVNKSTK